MSDRPVSAVLSQAAEGRQVTPHPAVALAPTVGNSTVAVITAAVRLVAAAKRLRRPD